MYYRFPNNYPRYKFPSGVLKEWWAYIKFFDHPILNGSKLEIGGIQSKLESFRNKHKNERCFIFANGPSLKVKDLQKLKNEVTIGCNGIYTLYDDIGYKNDYYFIEDINQAVIRGKEISDIAGLTKFCALHNAHALKWKNNFNYFYVPTYKGKVESEVELFKPTFSRDFAGAVYLGYTITYIMLQFAYYIGCKEVYILGLDHNYGDLPKYFPPGKIKITEENYDQVRKCHFDPDYYKIGDVIGIPYSKNQEIAYREAKHMFERENKTIINLTPDSKLDVFPIRSIDEIF